MVGKEAWGCPVPPCFVMHCIFVSLSLSPHLQPVCLIDSVVQYCYHKLVKVHAGWRSPERLLRGHAAIRTRVGDGIRQLRDNLIDGSDFFLSTQGMQEVTAFLSGV